MCIDVEETQYGRGGKKVREGRWVREPVRPVFSRLMGLKRYPAQALMAAVCFTDVRRRRGKIKGIESIVDSN